MKYCFLRGDLRKFMLSQTKSFQKVSNPKVLAWCMVVMEYRKKILLCLNFKFQCFIEVVRKVMKDGYSNFCCHSNVERCSESQLSVSLAAHLKCFSVGFVNMHEFVSL